MGSKYSNWHAINSSEPKSYEELAHLIQQNRRFELIDRLDYGDYGLEGILDRLATAISEKKKIALYADYDVDGTMSCVSWIWFLQAIGYSNYIHYIPCRFQEGYGVNLEAVKHLIHNEHADVIITMDTGITANQEAAYCKEQNVTFICTDHHKIQKEKMPDCLILNPKLHPLEVYQELCGCGITFVLLRKLGLRVGLPLNSAVWTDILGLTGMATICDVVPLNGVNHRLAKMGVAALMKSSRPILKKLRESAQIENGDEKDIGFRLGPRINAVGRLEHADVVISAFLQDEPDELIAKMNVCNERRKLIQAKIVEEARTLANSESNTPILFLGGDWHPGVVGIAASKLAEDFWRPTWLFQRKDGICKGSARSIKGFDVTEAMMAAKDLFTKFGGHAAAGGFSFPESAEPQIRETLTNYAISLRNTHPNIWKSRIDYDCRLGNQLVSLELVDLLDQLKPFGHGFEEPKFSVKAKVAEVRHYADKITGKPKHTNISIESGRSTQKIMFFNTVIENLSRGDTAEFIVTATRNVFRGQTQLQLLGSDYGVPQ